MDMHARITNLFTESIQTKIDAADSLPDHIARAADILVNALTSGNKILCCGNGGSAGDAGGDHPLHRPTGRPGAPRSSKRSRGGGSFATEGTFRM